MSAVDRILASLEALTKLFTARSDAAFLWRYSVEEVTETSFSGRRLSPDCPFDDVVKIPLAPGIAGAGVAPQLGSVALVAFLDGDPSLPRCVGWDQAVPSSITVDASTKLRAGPSAAAVEIAGGGPAVHRVNDLGTGGAFIAGVVPGLITYTGADGTTLWGWTFTSAAPGSPVVIASVPVTGSAGAIVTKATAGSVKVTCG